MQPRTKAKISNFQIVLPKSFLDQKTAISLITTVHYEYLKESQRGQKKQRSLEEFSKVFDRFSCSEQYITKRGFDNPDVTHLKVKEKLENPEGQSTPDSLHKNHMGKKMDFFLERSTEVLQEFYQKEQTAPAQIIHVSCTGYISPSAAQRVVTHNEWQGQTGVTHAYHMGCYASLPAVRMADSMTIAHAFKKEEAYQVDVVHTEMCSLHMNPHANSPEQFVIQSLFADGHIKYSLNNTKPQSGRYFEVEHVAELLVPNSEKLMSWSPNSWGMEMTLSREVPGAIQEHIKPFLEQLLKDAGVDFADTLKNAIFAVHPGGPKIIEQVQRALELKDQQVSHSKAVLLDRGNMSSATLPHVWKSILEDETVTDRLVVSLAFGPGLTVFGSVYSLKSQ